MTNEFEPEITVGVQPKTESEGPEVETALCDREDSLSDPLTEHSLDDPLRRSIEEPILADDGPSGGGEPGGGDGGGGGPGIPGAGGDGPGDEERGPGAGGIRDGAAKQSALERMSRAFGHDFSHVQLHTDSRAQSRASDLDAHAFAVGTDVFFGTGEFAPGTKGGDRLMAHELTHVVQHDEGALKNSDRAVSRPDDPEERQAYAMEDAILQRLGDVDHGEEVRQLPASPTVGTSAPAMRDGEGEGGGDGGSLRGSAPDVDALIGDVPPDEEAEEGAADRSDEEGVTSDDAAAGGQGEGVGAAEGAAPQPAAPASEGETVEGGGAGEEPVAAQAEQLETEPPIEVPEISGLGPDLDGVEPTEGGSPAGADLAMLRASAISSEARGMGEQLASAGRSVLAAITAQVEEAIAGVMSAHEQAATRVSAAFDAEIARVGSERDSAIAAIEAARAESASSVQAQAEAQRTRVSTELETRRSEAEATGNQVHADILALGETEAQRAISESENRAQQAEALASQGSAGGDEVRADAQRDSATRIAERAAERCRETGEEIAQEVRSAARDAAERVAEKRDEFTGRLGEGVDAVLGHVDELATRALAQVDGVAAEGVNGVETLASAATSTLEQRRESTLARLEGARDQAVDQFRQAGLAMTEQVTPQIEQMREMFTTYGETAAAQIEGMGDSDDGALDAALAQCRTEMATNFASCIQGLDELSSATRDELDGMLSATTSQLSGAAESAATDAAEVGNELAGRMQEASSGVVESLSRSATDANNAMTDGVDTFAQELATKGQEFRTQLQELQQEAATGMAEAVDAGLAREDEFISEAAGEIGSVTEQIGSRYDDLKSEAERRSEAASTARRSWIGDAWDAVTGFVGDLIDTVRQWFLATFGDFWGGLLFGILFGLVIVVLAWAAISLIGAIVGLFIASAKIVAIVTICIALAIAIPLAIYSRFQEFYADNPGEDAGFWRGLGLVGLGIADLTGIPFIVEALVGQRAFGDTMETAERTERFGMGIVFLGAAILGGIRRGKARGSRGATDTARTESGRSETGRVEGTESGRTEGGRVEGNEGGRTEGGRAEGTETPRTAPEGLSPELTAKRASLTDSRAVRQFDSMFERMGRDSGRMERAVRGMERGSNLQDKLIEAFERANQTRTPHGEAIGEVPELIGRAERLLTEVEAYRSANPEVQGANEMMRAVRGELRRLQRMQRGEIEATPEGVQGTRNNLNGVEAELNTARGQTAVTGVNRKFSLDGVPDKVEVDVVADQGRLWIDSKRVEPFSLESSDWVGGAGKQGLRQQASEMLRSARQNPVDGATPRVRFEFPLGVTRAVARALRRMGIEVGGEVVDAPAPLPQTPARVPEGDEE